MIPRIFRKLFDHYGPQHWWPAATPFEVAVGAILTQSVSWANVEKAIANLRREGLLEPQTIHAFADSSRGEERLGELIRPSGYFRVKARKLLSFSGHLQARHGGSLDRLFAAPTGALRAEILGIWGIGKETADSILLYAAGRPVFVIDAYTLRILSRLGLEYGRTGPGEGSDSPGTSGSLPAAPAAPAYDEAQRLFMASLPPDPSLYGEYHALLVALGKEHCRKRGCLGPCPLREYCRSFQGSLSGREKVDRQRKAGRFEGR